MRKIVLRGDAGIVGTDYCELYEAENETDAELSDIAWETAVAHAQSYGIEEPDEDDEDREYDFCNVEGWWEEYDPEEHDGLLA